MKNLMVLCLFFVTTSLTFAEDIDRCGKQALEQAHKYANTVNYSSKLQGKHIELEVDSDSLRKINHNEYGVKMSSDHGGPYSYYGRELVLTGNLKTFSCKIELIRIYKLEQYSPASLGWSKLLFESNQGI